MSYRWTLDDIDWDAFVPERVDADLLKTVKTASLVEANSADYVAYLNNVFPDDADFQAAAEQWGREEAQHGAALGRWAEIADPDFDFQHSLELFRAGFRLPLEVSQSVRGSQAGELIARSVVESGTSSFYSAIRDATDEPVLKEVCRRIAIDEFHHYQLFQKHLKHYTQGADLNRFQRLKIAVTRVNEAEDDEFAYAYFAANVLPGDPDVVYDMDTYAQAYWRRAMALYREQHLDNATRMILRAVAIKPHGLFGDVSAKLFWKFVQWKVGRLEKIAA